MIIAVACLLVWCLILTCVNRAHADAISTLEARSQKDLELWRGQIKYNDQIEKDLTRVEDRRSA